MEPVRKQDSPPPLQNNFGYSLALSFDATTAVASDFRLDGARILTRSGSVWTEQGRIVSDSLGGMAAVALSGDGNTVLAGETSFSSGLVHVYVRNNGTWTQQARLAPAGRTYGFGNAVSLSALGYTAIIGDPSDNNATGAAWIFVRSGTTWTQQAKLVGTGAIGNAGQGYTVALSPDATTAIVGGPLDNNSQGAAWVLVRNGNTWTQQAKLVGMGAVGPSSQGMSVSLSGDGNKAIIGGPDDEFTPQDGPIGAAWIFTRTGSVWTQLGSKLRGTGAVGFPAYGISVAMAYDGGTAIVGGSGDNYGRGAAWVFVDRPLTVTRPANSEVVFAGEPYDIQWQTNGIDSIKIEYSLDSGKTYQGVVSSIAANQNRYTWIFPDTLSTRCKVRISDVIDSTINALSGRFRLKGYVLTRINSSGDYEAFSTEKHGWSFKNDSLSMWPRSWWSQFDYAHGNDPNTGKPYFHPLARQSAFVAPSDFSDWPLFVDAFQKQCCYKSDGWVTTKALDFWMSYRVKEFKGTCSGFTISSLLAFTNPEALREAFPTIGTFENLRQLPLNDERRKIINQLSWHQMDAGHTRNAIQQKTATPRQTLAQLKSMLHAEHADPGYLGMLIPRPSIAHAVDAFKLTIGDRVHGRYWLNVYDSNEPNATRKSFLIDSSANTWSANPAMTFSHGLFLEDPVSTYLPHPLLPGTNGTVAAAHTRSSGQLSGELAAGAATPGELYVFTSPDASTAITNANGESIGFTDSIIIDAMPGAMPIVPVTGSYAPPVGYVVPNVPYTARLGNFGDSVAYCRIFGDTASYSYDRSDATPSQSDNVRIADGFSIGNRDNGLKHMNFRTIVSSDSLELTFDISRVHTFPGDSLQLRELLHSDLLIANYGAGKTYDLDLYLGSPTRSGQFSHPSVRLDGNSSHRIVPPWKDLATMPVKILIDNHNSGTFDDSIFVSNQTTGAGGLLSPEIPCEFRLEQNFPNPFNPSTTIRYGLPNRSHVSLTVFNTLGQQVVQLVNGDKEGGYHEVKFDGSGLSSGVYFYRLRAGDFVETRKLLFVR